MSKFAALAIPLMLACILVGATIGRGFMSSSPTSASEGVEKDLRRASVQISALEKRIAALERLEPPAPAVAASDREPEPSAGNAAPRATPASPAPPSSDRPTGSGREGMGDPALRDLVRQVFEERDRQTEQQRDERRKAWELRSVDSWAERLTLSEAAKAGFREVMLDYQAKAREAYRSQAGAAPIQAEIRKLQQERDAKLAPYLSPDQIRRLHEPGGMPGERSGPR